MGRGSARGFRFSGFSVLCLLFSVFCSLSSAPCPLVYADKIYLKDGKVYEGKVLGKSERRYLFGLDLAGEQMPISFFMEDVAKVEMSKDSAGKQIPYLKEVEAFKVEVKEEKPTVYEVSLYKKNPDAAPQAFTDAEARSFLKPEEFDYYARFNEITKKFADKFSAIDEMFKDLTMTTKDDFESAKQYMDDLYFQLNALHAPEVFKQAHLFYLGSVKAMYLAFNALGQGLLDEAGRQIKVSQESRERSLLMFREILENRHAIQPAAEPAAGEARKAAPQVAGAAQPAPQAQVPGTTKAVTK